MYKIFIVGVVLLTTALGNYENKKGNEAFLYLDDTTLFKNSKTRFVSNDKITTLPYPSFILARKIYDIMRWPEKEYILENSLNWEQESPLLENSRIPSTKPPDFSVDTTIEQSFNRAVTDLRIALKEQLIPKNIKKYFIPLDGAIQGPLFSMVKIPRAMKDSIIRIWDFPKNPPASVGSDAFISRYKVNDFLFQCYLDVDRFYFTIANKKWEIPAKQLNKEIVTQLLLDIVSLQIDPESLKWEVIEPWIEGSIFLKSYLPTKNDSRYSREIFVWFDGETMQIWWQRRSYPWHSDAGAPATPYHRGRSQHWLKR